MEMLRLNHAKDHLEELIQHAHQGRTFASVESQVGTVKLRRGRYLIRKSPSRAPASAMEGQVYCAPRGCWKPDCRRKN